MRAGAGVSLLDRCLVLDVQALLGEPLSQEADEACPPGGVAGTPLTTTTGPRVRGYFPAAGPTAYSGVQRWRIVRGDCQWHLL